MIKFPRGSSSSNIVGIPAMQTPPFPVVIETSRFCICVFLCVFLYLLALQLCGPLCRNRDIWSGTGNVLEKKKNSRKQFLIIIFICCESNQIWFNLRTWDRIAITYLQCSSYHGIIKSPYHHIIAVPSYHRITVSLYHHHHVTVSSYHRINISSYHDACLFPLSRLLEIQSRPHWETWR